MPMCFIYSLSDEHDTIFYVGVTNNTTLRYRAHLAESRLYLKRGMQNWVTPKTIKIAQILQSGCKPTLNILESCEASIADEREIFYYRKLSKANTLLQTEPIHRKGRYTYAYKFK